MDGRAGIGIRRVGQVGITVRDVDRARNFYRDVLELRHLFDAPPGMAFFDCSGVRLMLAVPEDDGGVQHPASMIYYDVPDIHAAHTRLAERGVRFERTPEQVADLGDRVLWLAFLRDSEDNVIALMSEVDK